jgi:hypothetical protein
VVRPALGMADKEFGGIFHDTKPLADSRASFMLLHDHIHDVEFRRDNPMLQPQFMPWWFTSLFSLRAYHTLPSTPASASTECPTPRLRMIQTDEPTHRRWSSLSQLNAPNPTTPRRVGTGRGW